MFRNNIVSFFFGGYIWFGEFNIENERIKKYFDIFLEKMCFIFDVWYSVFICLVRLNEDKR